MREPEALFWVYGFPILMTLALGIAFRNQPVEQIAVDVVAGPQAEATQAALARVGDGPSGSRRGCCRKQRRRRGCAAGGPTWSSCRSDDDDRHATNIASTRRGPQSVLARKAVDDQLQRAAGRRDVAEVTLVPVDAPGSRYIDFLVPGLLGMSLMGGGLWGVGFVTVDMRRRNLLKRFLATPMKKSHFLAGLMISRMAVHGPRGAGAAGVRPLRVRRGDSAAACTRWWS